MCLGGKQNYSFRLTFETFIIWDEENASHCFSFVKLDFHDNFVLYCSHSAFLDKRNIFNDSKYIPLPRLLRVAARGYISSQNLEET